MVQKVLVVSRHFPPLNSVGYSIRVVKFIKYIAQHGWEFVILTQHPEHSVVSAERLSAFMESEIPPETSILHVAAPFSSSNKQHALLYRWFSKLVKRIMPRSSLWWGICVFWQGLRRIWRKDIDVLYAVTPVFTNALVGTLLSLLTCRPLILDIKDDWVGSADYFKKSALRKAIDRWFEKNIICLAASVILVTERSYHLYQQRYPRFSKQNKFCYIPNGCDLEEYQSIRNKNPMVNTDQFLILSAAWGYKKDYRDITPFFLGIERFLQRYPQARHKLNIVLLGNSLSDEYNDLVKQTGLEAFIRPLGSVSRPQLVEWLWKADLFFLVQPVGNVTAISGTLYEYWAVGKAPILLISETGASSELVEKYNLGKKFHFDDIENIASYVAEIYRRQQDQKPETINLDGIYSFDRKALSSRLSNIFDQVQKKRKGVKL